MSYHSPASVLTKCCAVLDFSQHLVQGSDTGFPPYFRSSPWFPHVVINETPISHFNLNIRETGGLQVFASGITESVCDSIGNRNVK